MVMVGSPPNQRGEVNQGSAFVFRPEFRCGREFSFPIPCAPGDQTPTLFRKAHPLQFAPGGIISLGPPAADVGMSADDPALAAAIGAPVSGTATLQKGFAATRQGGRGGAGLTRGRAKRFAPGVTKRPERCGRVLSPMFFLE
jgi:hypothetical protein